MITDLKYSQIHDKKDLRLPLDGYDYLNSINKQTPISKTLPAKIKRVMIVDDSNDVNLTFKIVLSESDRRLRVHSFNDPLVALQEFSPNLYDLIIIDILMPKMNGFELYDKMRELDSKVKICFLTAASEISYEDVIREALPGLETNCFIRKPIANEDLIKQVKEILELQ
jgi:two-component SAPR family response regulator